jgi:16S rRNA G966 N2-methylase RsmD
MYIYGAPCRARNLNVVHIYIYRPTFGNAESRLFLFAAQCFNTESMKITLITDGI